MSESRISVCRALQVNSNTGCGVCSIHNEPNYPSICSGYFCEDALLKITTGDKNPCKGCTVQTMAENGCCTNPIKGGKVIEITREDDSLATRNPTLDRIADLLISGEISPEKAEERLKKLKYK